MSVAAERRRCTATWRAKYAYRGDHGVQPAPPPPPPGEGRDEPTPPIFEWTRLRLEPGERGGGTTCTHTDAYAIATNGGARG